MRTLLILLLSAGTALAAPVITQMIVVNAETGVTLTEAPTYGTRIYIRALCNSQTKSVRFIYDGVTQPIDNAAPWKTAVITPAAGDHTVNAVAFPQTNGQGTPVKMNMGFRVDAAGPPTPTASPTPSTTPPSPSPTATPTASPSPSSTPSATPSATPVPTTTPTATPSPSGGGIASKYPGDKGIGSDPAVILADDFESYTGTTTATLKPQLEAKWTTAQWAKFMSVSNNAYAGKQSIQMSLPVTTSEVSQALIKKIAGLTTLYVRVYMKWDPGYSVSSSNHNGIYIGGGDVGGIGSTGAAPNGTDFFLAHLQNNNIKGEAAPGYLHEYVYWPKQGAQWGDHWYPTGDGFVQKTDPNFKPMPNFIPQRDRWYCYEQMVRINTIGKVDGEVKVWVDGAVVADWPDLVFRTVDTLKIDEAYINLHCIKSDRLNLKWYDNAVIATQYIGPMTPP